MSKARNEFFKRFSNYHPKLNYYYETLDYILNKYPEAFTKEEKEEAEREIIHLSSLEIKYSNDHNINKFIEKILTLVSGSIKNEIENTYIGRFDIWTPFAVAFDKVNNNNGNLIGLSLGQVRIIEICANILNRLNSLLYIKAKNKPLKIKFYEIVMQFLLKIIPFNSSLFNTINVSGILNENNINDIFIDLDICLKQLDFISDFHHDKSKLLNKEILKIEMNFTNLKSDTKFINSYYILYYSCMIYILLFHEIGHHDLNHTKTKMFNIDLFLLDKELKIWEEPIYNESQQMEFQADAYSIIFLIDLIKTSQDKFFLRIEDLVIGSVALFLSYAFLDKTFIASSKTHPSHKMRLENILNIIKKSDKDSFMKSKPLVGFFIDTLSINNHYNFKTILEIFS